MSPSPYGTPNNSSAQVNSASPTTSVERNWGMACHLSSLCGFVGVPFGNIIGPLVCWLIKKNDSAFVDEQGRESLNFHISLWIYFLISGILCFTIVLLPLALIAMGVIWVMGVVCAIVGASKASNGEVYRYPLTIRFIS